MAPAFGAFASPALTLPFCIVASGAHLLRGTPDMWATPFDPADPVNTPADLDIDNPEVAQAVLDAWLRDEVALSILQTRTTKARLAVRMRVHTMADDVTVHVVYPPVWAGCAGGGS